MRAVLSLLALAPLLVGCVVVNEAPVAPAQTSYAAPAGTSSNRAALDQSFVSWCAVQSGATLTGCDCMPGAL